VNFFIVEIDFLIYQRDPIVRKLPGLKIHTLRFGTGLLRKKIPKRWSIEVFCSSLVFHWWINCDLKLIFNSLRRRWRLWGRWNCDGNESVHVLRMLGLEIKLKNEANLARVTMKFLSLFTFDAATSRSNSLMNFFFAQYFPKLSDKISFI
jgi:hypothetical protein